MTEKEIENNRMMIRNLVKSLDILEEKQDALHHAITNETKGNLQLHAIILELVSKIREKITCNRELAWLEELLIYTLEKLEAV